MKDNYTIRFSIEQLSEVAGKVWGFGNKFRVWAFYGEMGAGKTSFIHALCDFLSVEDAVSSPTFSLINEYEFEHKGRINTIFHIDLYRIKNTEEALEAGIGDSIRQMDAYSFIEWAEKAAAILPAEYLHIDMEVLDETTRKLTCKTILKNQS